MEQRENKMGTMPIGRLILTMSGPAILSMVIQALYNVVDSIFVAQLGERALEAITIVFPVQMLLIAVGVGTGVGINSYISRSLGAREFDNANTAAGNGFKLAFFGWMAFAVFGLFGSRWFMGFFTKSQYVVDNGTSYLTIVTTCSLFLMIAVTSEKIIQATGNMVLPMFSSITGAVINIALDPILIFGLFGAPKMGVAGAAIATVIGQMCGMVLILILLFKKNKYIHVNIRSKFNKKVVKNIYAVGGPAIIMQAIGSVMLFGLNAILAGISGTAVAVLGVYGRLQSFIFMPVFGINQGSMPVMGYNYGARNRERLMKAFWTALTMAFSIMCVGLLIFELFPGALLGMFNASDKMYEIGVPALRIISICFLPASIGITSAGLFQATGHGIISLFGSLVRQLVGILPLAWIFANFVGNNTVWWAFALAEILGVTYCIIMLRFLYNNKIKNIETVSL